MSIESRWFIQLTILPRSTENILQNLRSENVGATTDFTGSKAWKMKDLSQMSSKIFIWNSMSELRTMLSIQKTSRSTLMSSRQLSSRSQREEITFHLRLMSQKTSKRKRHLSQQVKWRKIFIGLQRSSKCHLKRKNAQSKKGQGLNSTWKVRNLLMRNQGICSSHIMLTKRVKIACTRS